MVSLCAVLVLAHLEWLLESQFDDKSLIKAFWKAHGGRPASLPKLESSVENHQLDPSDTDEAAYKHPISKAKRARKKIRTEVRRDKKIVRQKKAQVESKKEQGSVSSASSLVEPETRNGKGIENGSESQLQDTSTEKTACLSSSADDDSDDIPLQPQRKRQRTQSQKTSSNLPQFTKKKQNASVETATSYPAATVSDSEEEWVPRPEAKQQRNISQQKGRVQAEVSDSDSDSDDMWKPPDQQALKEKPSTTRGASTSSTASPEKALDQGQLKQPPHSVSWKGAHKRDPRVKLDDPVGPKASSSKYGIATSQPSLSSTASISKASLLPSEPSENNTKFLTNGIGLSASPTHLSASTPSPIGNKFASSKSSGQVNLHPTQASSTYKIPLQEKLGISGTALEVITSGLHDHFVIGPVGGDDTLAALLEVSKCSSLGASNLAKELGRPSAIWIEYQTRYILERGWLPEREMSEIKRKAIGECLHSAKLRYSAQFFLYGNFPSGQLFQATSAFPKQGGGIVTFTLAGLLHYAIHSNQAFMELAEVFHFGQLQELPPGMVRGFRLWSLKEELPPSWEVVIHPWIIAFLEDFLGKGQLAQVIEKFGIVGQGGASRPPGLIDEMIDNLPEFARKLDWDETCSQDAHAPAADSMLQVFAALDQEVISTMHKLQRLTMREKRFHIILTPDGSLVKGHHKGTEFGGVGIMEIEGLRRLAADQSQW